MTERKRCSGIVRKQHTKQCDRFVDDDNEYCDHHDYFNRLSDVDIERIKAGEVICCNKCGKWHFSDKNRCQICIDRDKELTKNKKAKIKKCEGLQRDGMQCENLPVDETDYCNIHQYILGYTEEQKNLMVLCKNCNKYKFTGGHKTCEICRERSEKNREKDKTIQKIICKGFVKNKPCNCEAKENGYCGNHQVQMWKNDVEKNNDKKVCGKYDRGCRNILDKNYEFSNCDKCRGEERDQDKNRRLERIAKNNNIELVDDDTPKFTCINCGKEHDKDKFINGHGKRGDKCIYCLEKQSNHDKTRESRQERYGLNDHISEIKKSAIKRNIKCDLTDDQIINIISHNCIYCGNNNILLNGIDRLDSKKHYYPENSRSCCSMCNMMKRILQPDKFVKCCQNIKNNYPCTDKFDNMDAIKHMRYNAKKYDIQNKRPHISFDLSEIEYYDLLKNKCFYCGNTNVINQIGIDRINSNHYVYSYYVVVACCGICNVMKRNYDLLDFYNKVCQIAKYNSNINKLNNRINRIPNKIDKDWVKDKYIEFFNSTNNSAIVNNKDVYKFKFNNKYYESLIYDTYEINNFNAELEFCEMQSQHDIWMYYRLKVSSFEYSQQYGRLIRILIRDKTTKKYVGIASLSSDVLHMKSRDEYLKFDIEKRVEKKKLNNIMNISTCIGIPPFSYNYNGGKLVAMLMFSEEVYNYYKSKYNEELVGLITLSLYGKSIQYDRLKELKLIGYTEGYSSCHIPKGLYDISLKYILQNNLKCKKYKSKLHKINYLLKHLKLNKDIMKHGICRGIYFGFFGENGQDYLDEKTDKFIPNKIKSIDEITQNWKQRWAINRFNNLINDLRLMVEYNFDNNIINEKDLIRIRVNKHRSNVANNKIDDLTKNKIIKFYFNNKDKSYAYILIEINKEHNLNIDVRKFKKIIKLND